MSKELPFFRFNVSEWLTGNIRYESFDLQGAFITACAEYWNRENKLTLSDISIRINSNDLVKKLIEKGYLKLKNGNVKISFLDEEREIIQAKHLKLSEAGRKGGLRVAKAGLKRGSSIKNKIKNKEIDKESDVDFFELFWSKYPNKTGKKPAQEKFNRLTDQEKQTIINTVDAFAAYKPFDTYSHPHATTYLNQRRWEDVIPVSQKQEPVVPREVWHVAKQIPAELERLCIKYNLTKEQFIALYK